MSFLALTNSIMWRVSSSLQFKFLLRLAGVCASAAACASMVNLAGCLTPVAAHVVLFVPAIKHVVLFGPAATYVVLFANRWTTYYRLAPAINVAF